MNYHVMEARYVSGHTVWLRFRDGINGDIDLKPELDGPMFSHLVSVAKFQRFRVDSAFHTLVWPNGADLAPEFLYN